MSQTPSASYEEYRQYIADHGQQPVRVIKAALRIGQATVQEYAARLATETQAKAEERLESWQSGKIDAAVTALKQAWLAEVEEAKKELAQSLAGMKATLETSQESQEAIQEELDKARQEIERLKSELATANGLAEARLTSMEANQVQIQNLTSELASAKKEIENLRSDVNAGALAALQKTVLELQASMRQHQSDN